jgi:hypothetical protein
MLLFLTFKIVKVYRNTSIILTFAARPDTGRLALLPHSSTKAVAPVSTLAAGRRTMIPSTFL